VLNIGHQIETKIK